MCGGQQHHRVPIVPAGVHHTVDDRTMWGIVLLGDRERIHVGAQADGSSGGPPSQGANDAYARQPSMDLQAEGLQPLGDEVGRRVFPVRQLRMRVQAPAPVDEIVLSQGRRVWSHEAIMRGDGPGVLNDIDRAPDGGVSYWARDHGGSVRFLAATFERQRYARHAHDFFAIGVITGGAARFFCRGTVPEAGPGDVIVVEPGEVHDGQSAAPNGWAYRMVYADVAAVAQLVGHPRSATTGFPTSVIRDREVAGALVTAHRANQSGLEAGEAEEALSRALTLLFERYAGLPTRPVRLDHARVGRAIDYLEANLSRRVPLSILAAHAGMERVSLLRAFAKATGLPPHAYQISRRIEEARRLIASGIPLVDVSIALGFCDQSHLNRHFKRIPGVTPAAMAPAGWRRGANGREAGRN